MLSLTNLSLTNMLARLERLEANPPPDPLKLIRELVPKLHKIYGDGSEQTPEEIEASAHELAYLWSKPDWLAELWAQLASRPPEPAPPHIPPPEKWEPEPHIPPEPAPEKPIESIVPSYPPQSGHQSIFDRE